jgi:acylglycerol lipase
MGARRKPKGVMVLCHGHGAYIPFEWCNPVAVGRPKHYVDSWVQRWNQEGYSVCGVDYQSHGRSEGMDGLRCHIESFQELVDDVLDFVQV